MGLPVVSNRRKSGIIAKHTTVPRPEPWGSWIYLRPGRLQVFDSNRAPHIASNAKEMTPAERALAWKITKKMYGTAADVRRTFRGAVGILIAIARLRRPEDR